MGKLHEILAVEGDLAGTSKKIQDETIVTFTKKPDHFQETSTSVTYFADSDQNLNTTESKAMVTTVFDKLKYAAVPVSKYLDAYYIKEKTNQEAVADVVLGGNVVFTAVPATVLLGMETKLKELRKVYESAPTLQPGPHWEKDSSRSAGTYRARDPEKRFVTKKTIRPIVLVQPTKEHPAQVEKIMEDLPVAAKTVDNWSGMLSPLDKSKLLDNLDKLIRAIKAARQRANGTEAVEANGFGAKVFELIHSDIVA